MIGTRRRPDGALTGSDGARRRSPQARPDAAWRRLVAAWLLTVMPALVHADPPVAVPDSYTVDEGQSIGGNVLVNDSDPEGDAFEAELASAPARHAGSFALNPDGSFTYVHDGGESVADGFAYAAVDPVSGERSAVVAVSITVDPVNDQPRLVSPVGDRTLTEDQAFSLDVSANFTDPEGDPLSFTASGLPVSGNLVLSSAGRFSGVARDADVGTWNVTVTARDPAGLTAGDSFRLTVLNVNDRPVITGQRPLTTPEETALTITVADLLIEDPDSTNFTLAVQPGSNYSVAGTTITPAADFAGNFRVPVTVDDSSGAPNSRSAVFELTVAVTDSNDQPLIAGQRTVAIDEDTQRTIVPQDLIVVDPDSDFPDDFTVIVSNGPDYTRAGATITPSRDFSGTLTVPVQVDDGSGEPNARSPVFELSVTVRPVNDQPRIVGQRTLVTPEETPLEITLNDLEVVDPDNDFPQDFSLDVRRGTNYRLRGTTITPSNNFAGVLSVEVTVDDGSGADNSESEIFVLQVTVTSQNDVPVITGQQPSPLEIDEDTTLRIGLDNLVVEDPDDQYPDDFTLGIEPGADYTVTGPDTVRPARDFNGLLVVNVTVSDPEDTSPPFGLRVEVRPVNDPPVITGQRPLSTEEETPLSITVGDLIVTDPDLPAQTLALTLRPGENYTLVGNTITPADEFSGTLIVPAIVSDGEADSELFDLQVEVRAVNDRPVITGQAPLSTPEDTPLAVVLADLIVEDEDNVYPDEFSLTLLPGDNYVVSGGSLVPATDFSGDLAVPVTVNDGSDDSEPFTLAVTVLAVNDVPVIVGQRQLATTEDTPLTIALTDLTVVDPDNDYPDEFILSLAQGENYTVSGTTVTPLADFNGRLDVPATVSDGLETSAPFELRIRVDAANDAPALVAPIPDQQAVENQFFRLDISGNFADADGDTLRFSIEGLPNTGNLSLNPDTGVLSGTPDFNDTRDFPYPIVVTASDESGATASGSFELTIAALDRANVALAIVATPSPALVGDQIRWTLTVTNAGPSAATNLGLGGRVFGNELSITAGTGNDCTVEPSVNGVAEFDCTVPDIGSGAQSIIVLSVVGAEPGDIMIAAEAATRGQLPIDPNVNDNADQLSSSVARELSNGAIQALGRASVRSIAAADVDGDGDPDLVMGTGAGQAVEIYRGTGFRTFEETPVLVADNAPNEGVAVADLDGDGDVDLVFANGAGLPDTIYTNDGAGGFLPLAALRGGDSRDVAIADFNRDGRPDLAFAAIAANPVFLNDGSGQFTLAAELGNAASLGVDSADFNGDGWPDLVFANTGAPSRIYLNDGGSGFLAPRPLSTGNAAAVAVVRADGNASPDLVFARVPDGVGDLPANPVFVNDGSGNFTRSEQLGGAPTLDVLVGDINADGRDDLIFINDTGTHQVWRGSNSGFRLNAEQIVLEDAVAGVSADLGNDSGDDVALSAGPQGGGALFLNDGFGRLGLGDAIAPELRLLGQPSIEIEAGTAFVDPGASANDNIDGDITARIQIDSPVNSSVVGTYRITYSVSDLAGNTAEPVTRSVRVVPAAGTGGGGGGSASVLELLMLLAAIAAGRHPRRTGKLRCRRRCEPGPESWT